jgi:hypothetical protein
VPPRKADCWCEARAGLNSTRAAPPVWAEALALHQAVQSNDPDTVVNAVSVLLGRSGIAKHRADAESQPPRPRRYPPPLRDPNP